MILENRRLKILFFLVLVGLLILVFSVNQSVQNVSKKDPSKNKTPISPMAHVIYIPSPVERAALNQMNALWPAMFSAERPLIASKLPHFYRKLFDLPERANLQLGAAQLAMVRSWSIESNTASLDALKISLLYPLEEIFSAKPPGSALNHSKQMSEPKTLADLLKQSSSRQEQPCSLFRMERLFRISQAWPQFQADVLSRYRSCMGPDDILTVWFELNLFLFSKRDESLDTPEFRASLSQRLQKIEQSGSPFDAHLASRLSQAAFLKSTHGG